ncbi:hypothetical protein D1013_15205 [Euzebyella marina]|uniref:Uncharacterized protein n=1 Tax=Euzebyella marina TaxID=1761453 RepID=A0A3G2L8P0_9FLAO|nr:manganese efflux pump [Euzebyella marina]AYN68629.1 hypothetical protein D1013_15205 [Euzebyella marina]
MNKIEITNKLKTAKINQALGVFIALFGLIVIFAMIFTETFVQQMTDLVAGLILLGIGGGMIWKSKLTQIKLNAQERFE